MLFNLLRYLSMLSVLITACLALFMHKKLYTKDGKFLVAWAFFSLFWELSAWITSAFHFTNTWLFSIYTITETWFVIIILSNHLSKLKKISLALGVLLTISTLIEVILIPSYKIITISRMAQGFSIIILCLAALKAMLSTPKQSLLTYQPVFWLYTSCLIFFAVHIYVAATYNIMMADDEIQFLWAFNDLATTTASGLVSTGLIVCARVHKDIYNV